MDLSDVIGEHQVLSVSNYSFRSPEFAVQKDIPLGMVRIAQVTLSCPKGEFGIIGVKSDPKSQAIELRLKELRADERCSIVRGGPYGAKGTYILVFNTPDDLKSYKFVVDHE